MSNMEQNPKTINISVKNIAGYIRYIFDMLYQISSILYMKF